MQHLAVVGGGTMGRGIAEVAAARGLAVTVVEVDSGRLAAAQNQVHRSVQKGIASGKVAAAAVDEVLARIDWRSELSAVAEAECVVEAVPEVESLKVDLFAQLDCVCRPGAILASNTSSISITRLAAATSRAPLVVGMHFFNPVPMMAPVEIVRGLATTDQTVAVIADLARQLGKNPLVVRDSPGFVSNRVLMPMINEAIFALSETVADARTIDEVMKQGCNHPMGPLQLADLVGLDVCLAIMRVLQAEFGDPKFRPCPLLVRMVHAGKLGRKSGEGFYRYAAG
jgi:3-hydroxybutyryl-CoA dehydrogenase